LIDFGTTTAGTSVTRTFTVTNAGTSALSLTNINPATLPTGFSLVSNLSATSLAPGQSATFTVRFDAPAAGSFGGSIAIANDDSDENPFDLQFQAVVSPPAGAEITLLSAGQQLSLGGVIGFGTTLTGYTLERTITIRNDGGSVLTLSAIDPATLPSGFSLLQGLTTLSLNPGEATSFIVRLNAAAAGNYGGQISLASSDADESPFTFQVTGSVVDPITPLVQVLDNGDPGTSVVGGWQRVSGKGYLKDIHTAPRGAGGKYATWTFNSLPQGEYRVWATWTASSTNATNSPFTLQDGSSTVRVSQKGAPSGLTANGARWRLLGTASIQSGQLVVKLTNAANGQVVADAIRIERVITVTAPTPEIGVLMGGAEVACGGSAVNFGARYLGDVQTRTFTVTNQGAASLTLSTIDPASLPAGFSLVQNIGTTFLTPGETTTFTVQMNAATVGSFTGTISVLNNDGNESPFTFCVSGSVHDPNAPLTRVMDDGTAGHWRVGAWTRVTTRGYGGDLLTANKGSGSVHSTWNFTDLPSGEYRVQATWRGTSTSATNAPYTLYSGAQAVGTVRLNQRVGPNDFWDGTAWENLGTVTVANGQLMVRLTNAANGKVNADAIRIERIATGAMPLVENSIHSDDHHEHPSVLWLSSLFVSQHQSQPHGLPVPSTIGDHPTAGASSSDEIALALSAMATPRERELDDVLDLLSQDRADHSDRASVDDVAADEWALGGLVSAV
jgi:archaellum component FlaF (FlaF/FlaG flagellin family)